MRLGYADPPYPGLAHLYLGHADYAGEVDHAELIARLERDFDGWILHTSAAAHAIALLAPMLPEGARWGAWVKSFAAFKKGVLCLGAGHLQATAPHGRELQWEFRSTRLDRSADDNETRFCWGKT